MPAELKVFLANDTSAARHSGCHAVMRSLEQVLKDIPEATVNARHATRDRHVDEAAFEAADVLFVNGEGSIHHDGPRSKVLLGLIDRAKRRGKRVLLVNALFQQYTHPDRKALAGLDLLTVREPRSAAFAKAFGGDPVILLDSAADPRFFGDGVAKRLTSAIVIGGVHQDGPLQNPFRDVQGMKLTPFSTPFADIVATLRGADLYLTGQHHGVYAAALAGCPFVAVASNSHKIEGLIEWSGLPVPVCHRLDQIEAAMQFALRNRTVFAEFQDFMATQQVLSSAMVRQALGLDRGSQTRT